MMQKMPTLVIPLINEAFGTSYSENVSFQQLRNEHEKEFGKIISDSIIKIESKTYHIECQSVDDTTMAIRMLEYDFSIALEQAIKNGRMYEIDFPESCVLYLRSSKVTPDTLKVKVNLPFGEKDNSFIYECKTIKLKDYTSDDIFKKKLLILLPFYIMKYEKKNKICIENEEELKQLLNEYDKIRVKLEATLIENQKSTLYTDLIKLIIKISNYVLQEEPEIKKGVEKIMGGKVLQLESERLEKKGINIGRKEGLKEGKNIGRKEGIDALIQTIKRFMPNATEEDIVNEIKKNDSYKSINDEIIKSILEENK